MEVPPSCLSYVQGRLVFNWMFNWCNLLVKETGAGGIFAAITESCPRLVLAASLALVAE